MFVNPYVDQLWFACLKKKRESYLDLRFFVHKILMTYFDKEESTQNDIQINLPCQTTRGQLVTFNSFPTNGMYLTISSYDRTQPKQRILSTRESF